VFTAVLLLFILGQSPGRAVEQNDFGVHGRGAALVGPLRDPHAPRRRTTQTGDEVHYLLNLVLLQ